MAKDIKKTPPQGLAQSQQHDLFSQFLSNDPSRVSNTVALWESLPKYFFTVKQVEKLRTDDGLANPYKWSYIYEGVLCRVTIQPALIEQDNGRYLACFPSVTEELIEVALKKILSDQRYGLHDESNVETWVRFSLSMLVRELKDKGRSRSKKEIKRALEVMSRCNITFHRDDKEVWNGAILQDLTTVGRSEYLADTDSQHVARLPLFISHAINSLEYRQFNYERLMSCDEQLTRWIYKLLINRFTQASTIDSYHFKYSTIKSESALLQQAKESRNRQKVKSAFEELVQRGVLTRYTEKMEKEGAKIIDVIYTLHASIDFIGEQKAANKRAKNNRIASRSRSLTRSSI